MGVRNLIAAIAAPFIGVSAFAQTQPTRPSAYATVPTMPSALATGALSPCYPSSSVNRTSPCYSGTIYPSYSALPPFVPRSQSVRSDLQGANSLDEAQAKQRIEAKGYSTISGLQKDSRGIWRGDATLKNGRRVEVILDLQGNIYSELVPSVEIWIRPLGN